MPSFETAASGKNKRTGIVLLRPLQAMQGWSLVEKQLDDTLSQLEADSSECYLNNPEKQTFHTKKPIQVTISTIEMYSRVNISQMM